jgi:hypothetical protein
MEFLRIYFDTQKYILSVELSLWLIALLVGFVILIMLLRLRLRRYRIVKLDIALANIGKVEFRPNIEDLQIAHRI